MNSPLVAIAITVLMLGACTHEEGDRRLDGTWRSNQSATISNALADPKWDAEAKKRIETIRPMFGKLTVTYKGSRAVSDYDGSIDEYPYRVLARGNDWVEIESTIRGKSQQGRLKFSDGQNSYWVDTDLGFPERFDRLPSEPSSPANGSQRFGADTNSRASAAGSRR